MHYNPTKSFYLLGISSKQCGKHADQGSGWQSYMGQSVQVLWCTLNEQYVRHFVRHSYPLLDQLICNFTITIFSLDLLVCFAFTFFTLLASRLHFLEILLSLHFV